jgi:hypothetical protein
MSNTVEQVKAAVIKAADETGVRVMKFTGRNAFGTGVDIICTYEQWQKFRDTLEDADFVVQTTRWFPVEDSTRSVYELWVAVP